MCISALIAFLTNEILIPLFKTEVPKPNAALTGADADAAATAARDKVKALVAEVEQRADAILRHCATYPAVQYDSPALIIFLSNCKALAFLFGTIP